MSFFSADARPCALTDVEGLLCARGQVSLFGGGVAARLGVVLGADRWPVVVGPSGTSDDPDPDPDPDHADPDAGPPADGTVARPGPDPGAATGAETGAGSAPLPDPTARYRAGALRDALAARGLPAAVETSPDGRPALRSAFRADLVPLARAWTRGAVKAVPAGFELDGPRLRMWVLAAGRRSGRAYLLGLDPHAEGTHEPLRAACRRAGVDAELGGDRAEPVLRVLGVRRRARLAELVGVRPGAVDDTVWPA